MSASIAIPIGIDAWRVRVAPEQSVSVGRAREPIAAESPVRLLEAALERPLGLDAPLRRALTPDDRVTVVIDESLPGIGSLLNTFLGHLTSAHIDPRNVTLLVATESAQTWLEELPDEYGDTKVEVHHAYDRDKLAYLATTKAGRRIYLNRTLVDAEVVAVLSARRFDPVSGYSGGEAAIFPALADEESQKAMAEEYRKEITKDRRIAIRAESTEILGLLGSSFLVQAIEGHGDGIASISVGMWDSAKAGIESLREFWLAKVEAQADLVIASISGQSDRIDFRDLAYALSVGKRALAGHGRLVLLTGAAPVLDEGGELLRKLPTPAVCVKRLAQFKIAEPTAASLWAHAANETHLFVKSGWPDEVAEELFATPLHTEGELQRLIDAAERVLILPDAHKMRVKIERSEAAE